MRGRAYFREACSATPFFLTITVQCTPHHVTSTSHTCPPAACDAALLSLPRPRQRAPKATLSVRRYRARLPPADELRRRVVRGARRGCGRAANLPGDPCLRQRVHLWRWKRVSSRGAGLQSIAKNPGGEKRGGTKLQYSTGGGRGKGRKGGGGRGGEKRQTPRTAHGRRCRGHRSGAGAGAERGRAGRAPATTAPAAAGARRLRAPR